MIELYTDETFLSFEPNATDTYPVDLVLLNISKKVCIFLIDYDHTSVGLLPVATSEIGIDVEDTVATLKESKIFLSAVVLLFNEPPSKPAEALGT